MWPLDPHPDDIDILDIAHALSLVCRYSGHCEYPYSVAQHSILVSMIVDDGDADARTVLTALMHDAAEAYIADIARPVKRAITQYGEIEHRLETVIAEKFGLIYPFPPCVKEADNIALATERRDLMPNPPRPWKTYGVDPSPMRIYPVHWRTVKLDFLGEFERLNNLVMARSGK
jgi:hypothetical protein